MGLQRCHVPESPQRPCVLLILLEPSLPALCSTLLLNLHQNDKQKANEGNPDCTLLESCELEPCQQLRGRLCFGMGRLGLNQNPGQGWTWGAQVGDEGHPSLLQHSHRSLFHLKQLQQLKIMLERSVLCYLTTAW